MKESSRKEVKAAEPKERIARKEAELKGEVNAARASSPFYSNDAFPRPRHAQGGPL